MTRTSATTPRPAFTLIEVLVVVAIIALLISILLPSMAKSRVIARKAACKSLLRQYQMAGEMYVMENQGVLMDSYNHLDPKAGIPKYLGSRGAMPREPARCADDKSTEELGRLGNFPQYGSVLVSIGCNENTMSASARMTSLGPMSFWFKRDKLRGLAWKMMTWADWQDNVAADHDIDGTPLRAIVRPVDNAIGSLVFRHAGASNAAFLDGHVGEMKPKNLSREQAADPGICPINNGHDLTSDSNWGVTSIGRFAKIYYPFGPAKDFEAACRGNWPTLVFP